MFRSRWIRFVSLFLVLALAGAFLVACSNDEDTGVGDDTGIVDEGLSGDTGVVDENVGVGGETALVTPFDTFDANGDTYIDVDEYNTFLNDNDLGFTTADANAFDQYDINNDGLLDANELAVLLEAGPSAAVDTAGVTETGPFDTFDANADTYIDPDEYNTFLSGNDLGFTEDDTSAFDQYDLNNDELLSASEFNALVEAGPGAAVDTAGAVDTMDNDLFTTFDANADTYIDNDEFNTFLSDNDLGFSESDATAFDQYDLDNDGLLDENEFNTLVDAGPATAVDTTDNDLFTTFDANADTYIDTNEFNTFLSDNDLGFSEDNTSTFDQYDLDNDELLSASEFSALVEAGPGASMETGAVQTTRTATDLLQQTEAGAISPELEATSLGYLNERANPDAALNPDNVGQLEQAWQITTDEMVTHMPLVDNGVVYFADWSGTVYAADAETGEVLWQSQVEDSVMSEWPWHGFAGTGALGNGMLFEASVEGQVYGIDAATGEVVWENRVADNEYAGNLSKLLYYDGLVYLGLQSVSEPLSHQIDNFMPEFRGRMLALDATTGEIVWELPLVEEPHNGVAVWSSFAVDPSMDALFFNTGNNYTGDATPLSDSMIAADAKTGEILWSYQLTSNDIWLPVNAVGPDFDFGAGPQLFDAEVDGQMRHLVGAGQKSGFYSVFDRETGEHVWSTFVGFADIGGGIRGEASIADGTIYAWSNNGYVDGKPPQDFPITVKALDAGTGRTLWYKDAAQPAIGWSSGFLANNVYFVGSLDGTLQAYNTENGEVLWSDNVGSAVGAPLIVAGDTLYVGAGVPQGFGGGEPAANGLFAYSASP